MAVDMEFLQRVDSPSFCERLFAVLPDVLFCLKDRERRYRAANRAFAERLGLKNPQRLIGRMAEEFFPPDLAVAYREQDLQVLNDGKPLTDELELVTNRDGSVGWYLATKVPLHDAGGEVIGLASISRDLRSPEAGEAEIEGIARVVDHVRHHLDDELRTAGLAEISGFSPTQLDRRMKKVYHLSTAQFVRKTRIQHAVDQLSRTRRGIADIALECGYGDQTAFTRQFRATVGMPPAAFRERSSEPSR
ncbi:AraC family transcriptional regulator [Haloferula helveola]|uniref:AraC family transcriptional regulator n=1 Tax=Haloferula helveola TaxID=490095 RepID=A0ABN6HDM1_9BACT|nr:AraC family transcriptional regulator [Haloferula helveola]